MGRGSLRFTGACVKDTSVSSFFKTFVTNIVAVLRASISDPRFGAALPVVKTSNFPIDVITKPASRRCEYAVSVFTLTALGPKEAECEL
jgi:hypothetical protein